MVFTGVFYDLRLNKIIASRPSLFPSAYGVLSAPFNIPYATRRFALYGKCVISCRPSCAKGFFCSTGQTDNHRSHRHRSARHMPAVASRPNDNGTALLLRGNNPAILPDKHISARKKSHRIGNFLTLPN